jgi:hypothetical protein
MHHLLIKIVRLFYPATIETRGLAALAGSQAILGQRFFM